MAKTPTYWDKRALKRLDDAEKMSDEYIKRIKRIYAKAYKDIEKDIESVYRNYSKDTGLDVQKLKELLSKKETDKVWKTLKRQGLDKYVKNNYKARISRLEQVQAQIYAKAKLIYDKEELEHTMCYKGVINDSYYKAVYDTQMGTGYAFGFSKIDKNLMDALLNERWSGKNYSERIWGNTDILADSLSDVISSGMMSGQSVSKMTKQIKDRFNVSKYYAERLVRTETNHFNNTADAMAYEDMGIEYYVFVATLDSRTSAICQNMDGKKFAYKDKQEGVNYPPLHPNCRSKTRGYVDEEYEKTLERRARNPKTGKSELIPNMTYKQWAEKNGLVKDNKPAKASKKVAKTTKTNNKPVKTSNKLQNNVSLDNLTKKLENYPKPIKMSDYDYKGLAYKLKDNGYLDADLLKTKNWGYEGEDLLTKKLLQYNKYDALPTILEPNDYDKLGDDYIKVYRGVKDNGDIKAKDINEQFRSGELYIGNGLFGNGTYTAVNKEVAEHFGTDIMEIAIPKNARILKYSDIEEEIISTVDKPRDWKPINSKVYDFTQEGVEFNYGSYDYANARFTSQEANGLRTLLNDDTFKAVSCNYDVIEVEPKAWYNVLTGEAQAELDKLNIDKKPYYVILNRGAVVVKKGG